MRTLSRAAAALALVMLIASCSGLLKKKVEEEAGSAEASTTEVADTGTTPAPAAMASNEGDVTRFPDETKLADVSAMFQRSYNVRESPQAGVVIAGVSKGTTVTQIAHRDKYFLIVFDNPKAPGTKLMGWVHKDAFSAVVADAGPLVCAKGEIALFSDTPFCGKLCSVDGDCPAGQACKGSANKLLPTGKAGDGVTVCTAFIPPAPSDAGGGRFSPARWDAGLLTVDGGKSPIPTPPAQVSDVVAAVGGVCPAPFVLVKKTNKCHRLCPSVADCKNPASFCIRCDNQRVCSESKEQCK
jgi:hypothetical protein